MGKSTHFSGQPLYQLVSVTPLILMWLTIVAMK